MNDQEWLEAAKRALATPEGRAAARALAGQPPLSFAEAEALLPEVAFATLYGDVEAEYADALRTIEHSPELANRYTELVDLLAEFETGATEQPTKPLVELIHRTQTWSLRTIGERLRGLLLDVVPGPRLTHAHLNDTALIDEHISLEDEDIELRAVIVPLLNERYGVNVVLYGSETSAWRVTVSVDGAQLAPLEHQGEGWLFGPLTSYPTTPISVLAAPLSDDAA